MYPILLQAHHYLAFLALILLFYNAFSGLLGMSGNKDFNDKNRQLNLITLIACHIMLLLGLVLLFMSPVVSAAYSDLAAAMKDPILRSAGIEHPLTNIIAIILVTLGYGKIKRSSDNAFRYKTMAIYFGLAFLLILSRLDYSRIFVF